DEGGELRIGPPAAHGGAAEENGGEEGPPEGVPPFGVEPLAPGRVAFLKESEHRLPRMDERQHPRPEEAEVALELAVMDDAARHRVEPAAPDLPRRLRQVALQLFIDADPVRTRP